MARIQVLELRPVESQIEDLSDNLTGEIRGGITFDLDPIEFLRCVSNFLSSLNTLGPIDAAANFLDCLSDVIFEV